MTFPRLIAERLEKALERLDLPAEASVTPATDPRFGHYQSNCAMILAKRLQENPRLLAQRLIDALRIDDLCFRPEVAGPGFLNFRIRPAVLARRMGERYNFYGLQLAGIDGRFLPDTSVEALADVLEPAIKRIQPRGPYHLGGVSFGGYVAIELARRALGA